MKHVILATLMLASTMAFANTQSDLAKIDADMKACLESPDGQSTVGMKICLNDAYEKADEILNRVYKQVVADLKKKSGDQDIDKINVETLRRLVASQRAWIQYRDTNSDLHGYTMMGGTGEGLEIASQAYDMVKERTQELSLLFGF